MNVSDSTSSSEDDVPVYERREGLVYASSSSSDSDVEEAAGRTRSLRNFRTRPDTLNQWNEEEFFIKLRLTKNTVMHLLEFIEPQLAMPTQRNHAVSPMNQLLLSLRFYATGNMLVSVGDFSGVHKSTASRCIRRVSDCICSLAPDIISMPTNAEDTRQTQHTFYSIARFPKVIGAIDCTHIRIQSPGGENAEYFRNRKGYFSINCQAISDASLYILNLVARWPGSVHDQTIFNNSQIHAQLEANEFPDSVILGDSGYALKKYLMTPILNPRTRGEQLFNESQIRTRNPVERLFGVLKRRFPVLAIGIRHNNLERTQAIILTCAVLHNIATNAAEDVPPVDPNVFVEPEEEFEPDVNVDVEDVNLRLPFIQYFNNLE